MSDYIGASVAYAKKRAAKLEATKGAAELQDGVSAMAGVQSMQWMQ